MDKMETVSGLIYFASPDVVSASQSVEPEQVVWTGHTSQMVNAAYILMAVYGFWLVVPLGYALWKILEVRCHRHTLTNHQLSEETGILNTEENHIELARITDIQLSRSWWQRILGLGDIRLISTDKTHPVHKLKSIHDPKGVARLILRETRKTNPNQNVNIHV